MHTPLLLDMAADAAPNRLAFGRRADGLTFEAARRQARGGAAFLSAQGGETVVFVGLNGPALPLAIFAAGLLGKPFAPLNYRLPDADLNRLLARTAPSVAIVDDDMVHRLQAADGVTLVSRSVFEAASAQAANAEAELPWAEPDIAVLLFTSGTTGEPKAAVLRHANLTSYVISTVEFLGAEAGEAALVSVPPYHIAGVSAVLTGVYGGRRIVHLEAFTPQAWVATAAAEAITHAMLVPTMLGRVLDVLEDTGERLPALKALSYGGGRMPPAVIARALRLLPHVDFVNAYGLTETSSTISVLDPDDHRRALEADDPDVRARLHSVGRPLPSVQIEIRGPAGEPLPPGACGEVHVRGEQIAGEYLHRKVIADDGWFATNDAGWMDDDGYLFVEGRLDDVIVRGGENISPGEIEDVLRTHPDIVDVAVVGVPSQEWGEEIAAVVVP
ncbi:MAG TPA: AMP-binding protein, partial [Phenylobacterium sp.]